MEIFRGIPVFPGVVIGQATIIEPDEAPLRRKRIKLDQVDREIAHFTAAVERLDQEIREDEVAARQRFGKDISMIFEAQRAMLADHQLHNSILKMIREDLTSAELATHHVLGEYIDFFRGMRNSSFADRSKRF